MDIPTLLHVTEELELALQDIKSGHAKKMMRHAKWVYSFFKEENIQYVTPESVACHKSVIFPRLHNPFDVLSP